VSSSLRIDAEKRGALGIAHVQRVVGTDGEAADASERRVKRERLPARVKRGRPHQKGRPVFPDGEQMSAVGSERRIGGEERSGRRSCSYSQRNKENDECYSVESDARDEGAFPVPPDGLMLRHGLRR